VLGQRCVGLEELLSKFYGFGVRPGELAMAQQYLHRDMRNKCRGREVTLFVWGVVSRGEVDFGFGCGMYFAIYHEACTTITRLRSVDESITCIDSI
jgi:hypothetical protein